jgi:hypothetical protein
MLLGKQFEAFVQRSPVSVMVRAVLEKALHSQRMDALFQRTAVLQYTRDLMFSTVVALMSEVVLGVSRSVRAAYQQAEEGIPVSITSVYNKLNAVEPVVSAELVRDSAAHLGPIIRHLGGEAPALLAGYRVRVRDGNHLSGTEHRIKELRPMRAAALPGQALVVLDPQLGLAVDGVPCEDGHAQERALFGRVLPMVEPGDLWIGDRNFCTTGFLFGIAARGGFFLIRQHASTLTWELLAERKSCGKTDSGRVYEQAMRLRDPASGQILRVRRITVALNKPTRDGETEVHLLTNVPPKDVEARVLSNLYLQRGTIERMFQELTVALTCEIHPLGYPKAALFGFCLALGGVQRGGSGQGVVAGRAWPRDGRDTPLVVLPVHAHRPGVCRQDDRDSPAALASLSGHGGGRVRCRPQATGGEHQPGQVPEASARSQEAASQSPQRVEDQTCLNSKDYRKTLA